jgi:hypothetical protein
LGQGQVRRARARAPRRSAQQLARAARLSRSIRHPCPRPPPSIRARARALSRQRLKEFRKLSTPLTCGAFNNDGNIFAYAASYDWSKGSEHYNIKTNNIWLHPVLDKETKPNAVAPSSRNRR